jgi:hypothetical protein
MNRLVTGLAVLIVMVGLYLVGGYIEYSTGFPFGIAFDSLTAPPLAAPAPVVRTVPGPTRDPGRVSTEVPIVSTAQGAQDAARADIPMGESIDLQRCYNTMIARKLVPSEARTVCAKLIGGITH